MRNHNLIRQYALKTNLVLGACLANEMSIAQVQKMILLSNTSPLLLFWGSGEGRSSLNVLLLYALILVVSIIMQIYFVAVFRQITATRSKKTLSF